MSQIDIVLLIASLVSAGAGAIIYKSLPLRLSINVNVALIAWLGREIAILNGDQTIAGDYLNGLNYTAAALEIGVAIVWMATCGWLGAVLHRYYNRFTAGS